MEYIMYPCAYYKKSLLGLPAELWDAGMCTLWLSTADHLFIPMYFIPGMPPYTANITRRSCVTTSHMVSQWLPFINTVVLHLGDALWRHLFSYAISSVNTVQRHPYSHIIIFTAHYNPSLWKTEPMSVIIVTIIANGSWPCFIAHIMYDVSLTRQALLDTHEICILLALGTIVN